MAHTPALVIGTQHGADCTCRRLEPFEVSITPVIVDRHCPAQDEYPRTDDTVGRITITWPRRSFGAISPQKIEMRDADTDAVLTTVTGLRVYAGATDDVVIAELRQFVDQDGQRVEGDPGGIDRCIKPDDGIRSAAFRYVVTEMRIAEA
jgi:hypothetical protein